MSTKPPPPLAERLGYLLKHAQLRFFELSASALAPLGVSGQEAAVLRAIDCPEPLSQGDIAIRMRIDRTTMVALIDDLEHKGLAQRRQDPADRRKNVVELTDAGRDILRRANQVAAEAEQTFLSPLPAEDRERFMAALRTLTSADRALSGDADVLEGKGGEVDVDQLSLVEQGQIRMVGTECGSVAGAKISLRWLVPQPVVQGPDVRF
jgi:DNA-binding MarR family transcriptional regulator